MAEPLTDAQLRCWRAFIESTWLLQTRLEDDLRAGSALSMGDYHVLVVLAEAPGHRLRMGELAGRLVFSPSRLTYQISTMEKRGLVHRESCPHDRRSTRAVLTPAGHTALREAAPHHLTSVRGHFVDDLDEAEIACLIRVFERLGPRLRTERGPIPATL
ncbi:MAG TPA: MarR family transcriptional regulator [Catenuloplanes sp.]|jgi:DNA-binding MarR family transcriptional regulator